MEICISLSCGQKNRPWKRPETLHRGSYWSLPDWSFPRSAWECRPWRSASQWTRSVHVFIPTRSVGTIRG